MTFSKAPDYIRDNLMKFEDAHFYKVPSINNSCDGCALRNHPDHNCYSKVKCDDPYGTVHSIVINTDETAIVRYIQRRLE